jgi:hypothetical protein
MYILQNKSLAANRTKNHHEIFSEDEKSFSFETF